MPGMYGRTVGLVPGASAICPGGPRATGAPGEAPAWRPPPPEAPPPQVQWQRDVPPPPPGYRGPRRVGFCTSWSQIAKGDMTHSAAMGAPRWALQTFNQHGCDVGSQTEARPEETLVSVPPPPDAAPPSPAPTSLWGPAVDMLAHPSTWTPVPSTVIFRHECGYVGINFDMAPTPATQLPNVRCHLSLLRRPQTCTTVRSAPIRPLSDTGAYVLLGEARLMLSEWGILWSSCPLHFRPTDPLFEDRGRLCLALHPLGRLAHAAVRVGRRASHFTKNTNAPGIRELHISLDWTRRTHPSALSGPRDIR